MMKTDLFKVALLFFVFAMLAGCENSFEGNGLSEKTISFTTFNARLTDDLPLYSERLKKLNNVLEEANSDILCIQEVYGNSNLSNVYKSFVGKNKEYYSGLYAKTSNEDFDPIPPACTQADVAPILSCYMENCTGSTDQTCIVTNCWSVFLTLPQVCQTCLLGQGINAITSGNIQEVLTGCMSETEVVYEYEGNNGIILLSKLPMIGKSSTILTSYGKLRIALSATVNKPGIGDIQVICAGVSPLSDEAYAGTAGSWEQEQAAQVSEILSIPIDDNIKQRVILGDFNGNIAGGYNITESNISPVSTIISAGYYDPYFDISEDDELTCTVCPENPMVTSGKESVPDHIFILNKRGYTFETNRAFINEFILIDEAKKKKTNYSLSDHYGLTVKMTVDPNF